jgi:hypothetical protein
MSGPWEKRQTRKKEVAARAAVADTSARTYCTVLGCGKLTGAAAGEGLNRRFCRAHEDFYERHGSAYRGSYGADWLNPYRRAAFEWLTAHADDMWVKQALAGVQGLYQKAGPVIEAFRLRGLKPEERARAAWARLRKANIDPRLPLAAWIAIEMITRDDPDAVRTNEYRRVQAAKIIHRIVSGSHKQWEHQRPNGQVVVEKLDKFPTSRGRVLRRIGEDIERVAELVVDKHLEAIRAYKREREQAGNLGKRAHPGRIEGVPKRPKRAPGTASPTQPGADIAVGPDPKRKRPYSVTLPNGTVVTYN